MDSSKANHGSDEIPQGAQSKEISNKNLKNEFVDYSIPLIATSSNFNEEDLIIIFKSEENKMENMPKDVESVDGTETEISKVSEDERLNFYFQVMDRLRRGATTELLAKSWEKAPLDTLKLLAYLRDCRQGKGVRGQYQHCLYWLYQYHPKTLANNLKHLASFGYWKDLLHFLMTIFFYGEVPHYLRVDDEPAPIKEKSKKRRQAQLEEIGIKYNQLKEISFMKPTSEQFPGCSSKRSARAQLQTQRWNVLNTRAFNNLLLLNLPKMNPEFVLKVPNFEYLPKNERRELTLKFARFRLETDLKYRYFHVRIAQLFAEQLQSDKKAMIENGTKIGTMAKYAPSVTNHFDKYTLIGTTIALELVKLDNLDLKMEKPYESVRAFLARKRYHKEYLVPLREYLKIPEVLISSKSWNLVDYDNVPSLCMRRYADLFLKHDKDRFEDFVFAKKRNTPGTTGTNGGLKPMQIISEIMTAAKHANAEIKEEEIQAVENQWRTLISELKNTAKGTSILSSALTICDVSESMVGEPLLVALGLTNLAVELTDAPWNEMCIPFQEEPSISKIIACDTLFGKIQKLLQIPTGMHLKFNEVFELVFKLAEANKNIKLFKALFVLTGMEFKVAFPDITQTNFANMKDKFNTKGFEMPKLIFWNLRGNKSSGSLPVTKDEYGNVLLSGYSDQLLKLILENQDVDKLDPIQLLESAIRNQAYDVLEIFD